MKTATQNVQVTSTEATTISSTVEVEAVALTRKQYRMVKRYRKLHIAETEISAQKKTLAQVFLSIMGMAKYATFRGEPVLRTQPSGRRSCDYEKLLEAFPEAYAACVTEAASDKRSVRTI
jgi:hypothetical protein